MAFSKIEVAGGGSDHAGRAPAPAGTLGEARGLLLGSVSHKVANLAPCSCITVK